VMVTVRLGSAIATALRKCTTSVVGAVTST